MYTHIQNGIVLLWFFWLLFWFVGFGLVFFFFFLLYLILLLFEKSFLPMYLVLMLGMCFSCVYNITRRPGHHHWSRHYHWPNFAVIRQKETFQCWRISQLIQNWCVLSWWTISIQKWQIKPGMKINVCSTCDFSEWTVVRQWTFNTFWNFAFWILDVKK